jgi:hypothetical protein
MVKSQPTLNFDLLLQAINIADPVSATIRAEDLIRENEIDWEDLFSISDFHSIKPQLAKLFSRVKRDLIPLDFLERINGEYRHNLYNQLSYVDDFFKVRNLLEDSGIQIIPFKGFWLAHQCYGNLAERESMDVDVFVNERDLELIKSLMEKSGYQEDDGFKGYSVEEIRRRFQEYNFDRFEGDTNRFHIEFHWGICPPGYGMEISLKELGSRIVRATFQGQDLNVFTPEAHLLLILLHHGGKDRFAQLKQVHDIACLLNNNRDIDWSWLTGMAKLFDAEALIYVGANLAAALTGISVPEAIRWQTGAGKMESLAKNRIIALKRPRHIKNKTIIHYDNWLFRMRTRNGMDTRFRITAATGRELTRKFFSGGSE